MLTATYDSESGLIRTMSSGFHTPEEVRIYLASLDVAVRAARRDHGRVRHLIDSVATVVQSAEVIEIFKDAPTTIGPKDKLAVLQTSALARMQTVRNFRSDQERFFATEAEALSWLMDEDAF